MNSNNDTSILITVVPQRLLSELHASHSVASGRKYNPVLDSKKIKKL